MSIVENLLLNLTDTKEIKSPKTTENFLLNLMKSYKNEPEKITDLLNSLKIDDENLDEILKKDKSTIDDELKNLIEEIKTSLKENLNKKNEKTIEIQTDHQTDQAQNFKTQKRQKNIIQNIHNDENLLAQLIQKPVSNDELEKKITDIINKKQSKINTDKSEKNELSNTNISTNVYNILNTSSQNNAKLEEKIVTITKKIITSTKTLENLKLSDKETESFKQIKTFKELVDFANKKELNISKVVLSYIESKKNVNSEKPLKFQLPKSKVNFKLTKSIKPDSAIYTKSQQNTQNDLLTSLLQNSEDKKESNNKQDQNRNTNKTENGFEKANINSNNFNVNEFKQNIHKAKESLKHFATNLKEAVENYKPPISKLSMELHPKELGKVEVTIVHRGDNLQIQINSNNTAISFMHSQQQELRQNLINMGFTDVNMSFNQNQQQGGKEYKQNQKFNNTNEDADELIIEIPYQYA